MNPLVKIADEQTAQLIEYICYVMGHATCVIEVCNTATELNVNITDEEIKHLEIVKLKSKKIYNTLKDLREEYYEN